MDTGFLPSIWSNQGLATSCMRVAPATSLTKTEQLAQTKPESSSADQPKIKQNAEAMTPANSSGATIRDDGQSSPQLGQAVSTPPGSQLLGKCKKQSGRRRIPPAITGQQSRRSSAQQWPDERRTQKYDRTRNGKDREKPGTRRETAGSAGCQHHFRQSSAEESQYPDDNIPNPGLCLRAPELLQNAALQGTAWFRHKTGDRESLSEPR